MGADDIQAIMSVLAMWLRSDVLPYVIELDSFDTYPTAMVEQMRDFGLFGATIPTEYGGLGLCAWDYAQVVELISESWMSLTGVLNSHLMMAELIRRYGTEAQREELLPQLADGSLRGGLALTEPDAGTDLQAIRTSATATGAGYLISGTKTWITNGMYGNCLAVLVKTDLHAQPRHTGTSLFFVRRSDGYEPSRKLQKLGYRGVDTVELRFNDIRVGHDALIGAVEGYGFRHTLGALELGRINVAARGVGIATAALNASVEYSKLRRTMGKPISQHQAIQLKLADMACRVASSRLLLREAANAFDEGRRCDLEAGMAKLVATEAALSNATDAMRIHGAFGYSKEAHIERYYRDAPLLCIGEGTNEIQRIVIAQHLVSN